MDIDLIFKIAAVGILVAVLNILLQRSGRDEQALMITIAGLVVVLFILTEQIGSLFDQILSDAGVPPQAAIATGRPSPRLTCWAMWQG